MPGDAELKQKGKLMSLRANDQALTVFILVQALPAWLAKSREDRRQIADTAAAAAAGIGFRQFDCEAFSAMCSDIWMLTVPSVTALNRAIERLKDTPLFAVPYFATVAILPSLEDGWKQFEAADTDMIGS
jgi:hypothetical protein